MTEEQQKKMYEALKLTKEQQQLYEALKLAAQMKDAAVPCPPELSAAFGLDPGGTWGQAVELVRLATEAMWKLHAEKRPLSYAEYLRK